MKMTDYRVNEIIQYDPCFDEENIIYEEHTDFREYRALTKERALTPFEIMFIKVLSEMSNI